MRAGCWRTASGANELLLVGRGRRLLYLLRRHLLRRHVDLVGARHRLLEVANSAAQRVAQRRKLARPEDQEDDDEDEQQLAEAEVHGLPPRVRLARGARVLPANFLRVDRPLVWGHRGASADAPENTHAAFA